MRRSEQMSVCSDPFRNAPRDHLPVGSAARPNELREVALERHRGSEDRSRTAAFHPAFGDERFDLARPSAQPGGVVNTLKGAADPARPGCQSRNCGSVAGARAHCPTRLDGAADGAGAWRRSSSSTISATAWPATCRAAGRRFRNPVHARAARGHARLARQQGRRGARRIAAGCSQVLRQTGAAEFDGLTDPAVARR